LSNFYKTTIYYEGEKYASVEHAYQAYKTLDHDTRKMIREATSPGAAKKLGQSVTVRPDWESVKVNIMRDLVRRKFENPFMTPLLLATGDALLVEGNWWGDTFWGVCNGVGQNWLGCILMDVREEFQKQEKAWASDHPDHHVD
jgi:ribA/ribD-fused uncharacterized protein